jgi:Cytochrome c oxidase subunit IV
MSALSKICFWLTGFLAIAGTVYGLTSHELGGATLLLVAAATFCFVGLVMRGVAHDEVEGGHAEEAEPVVAPTIWPLGFAVSAMIIAFGLVVNRWLLAAGAVVFAVSAAGWLREVSRSRTPSGHS